EPAVSKLYVTPGFFFSTQPTSDVSCEFMNTKPVRGSMAVPPQLTPPVPPGNEIVDFGGAPSSWNVKGVNGPSLANPPLRSHSAWHAAACSAVVCAALTMSSLWKLDFAS